MNLQISEAISDQVAVRFFPFPPFTSPSPPPSCHTPFFNSPSHPPRCHTPSLTSPSPPPLVCPTPSFTSPSPPSLVCPTPLNPYLQKFKTLPRMINTKKCPTSVSTGLVDSAVRSFGSASRQRPSGGVLYRRLIYLSPWVTVSSSRQTKPFSATFQNWCCPPLRSWIWLTTGQNIAAKIFFSLYSTLPYMYFR